MTLPTRCLQNSIASIALACVLMLPALADDVEEAVTGKHDTERVPTVTVMPEYPEVARRDRIEGEVQVCFEITRDGQTRRIAVRKSTHRLFEKPARRAVRSSTYAPVPKDMSLSGIKACRTFRFTLEPVVVETPN